MSEIPSEGELPSFATTESPASTVALKGDWTLDTLAARIPPLTQQARRYSRRAWDLREIGSIDDAGATLLWHAWGAQKPAALLLRPEQEALFNRLAEAPKPPRARRRRVWSALAPVSRVGERVVDIIDHLSAFTSLLGQTVLDVARIAGNPARMPWREISANVHRTGAQALPITALVSFLIGIVLSYLSARQLKLFGADVYIVDILGISILRELGPVLAAILVAGRSGSSMTAQLGVMRVTQELDALAVLGIPYSLRLVLPKIVALAIALPLLVLWTDAIALLGGMVAAGAELNIGYRHFISALPGAVPVANLWLGLAKGAVFGVLIGLVSCHFGLRIKPNTESLGAGTTNSVVTAITVVILVDAIFAVAFSEVGIP